MIFTLNLVIYKRNAVISLNGILFEIPAFLWFFRMQIYRVKIFLFKLDYQTSKYGIKLT